MRRFKMHEPGSVQEASRLLAEYGDNAKAFAGGTELLMLLKLGVLHVENLVNLKHIPRLGGIRHDEASGWLRMGALMTHREMEKSPVAMKHMPVLCEMEHEVANVRVRNMGTVAGNLCFADPYSDPGTLLTALGAELTLQKGRRKRTVPIGSFLVDAYSTSREDEEILVEIGVPPLPARSGAAYETFRFYERPSANVAVVASMVDGGRGAELRVAVGAAGPVPTALGPVRVGVRGGGSGIGEEAARTLGSAIDKLDLLEDFHGSKEYKRNLLKVLIKRATPRAVADARKKG